MMKNDGHVLFSWFLLCLFFLSLTGDGGWAVIFDHDHALFWSFHIAE